MDEVTDDEFYVKEDLGFCRFTNHNQIADK